MLKTRGEKWNLDADKRSVSISQPESTSTLVKKPRVLLLDDDPSIVSILTVVLTKAGFECHAARDGHAGFDMACALLPEMMIIDVNLPSRSGFEVLTLLRQNPQTANIRTMMLTACDEEADIESGLRLGANDYITKPFNPMAIAARVKSLLGST